ncbi:uncharacterized protein PRCAT00002809001 [Priceomyces carsonii]|uniref:uncharacterized protein n=1 Tax=Priceomyces carsonii TaxID=28549 RepID=UPI002ED81783|nr:unnamed protein product [Priceomyces carsonii]
MDSSKFLKRPLASEDVPDPDAISSYLKHSYKKQKIPDVPRSLKQSESAPILHSVPPSMIPIIRPPLHSEDFFTDLTTELDDMKVTEQVEGMLRKFPPPIPPYLPDLVASSKGGIMIPFIYPPPPIIDPLALPYSKEQALPNRGKKKNLRGSPKRTDSSPLSEQAYVQLPPLPFPPPNYMPYPLISDESTLTPGDVFASFLEALEVLPRTDMVLASAAGSLLDIRSQAREERFSIRDFEDKRSQIAKKRNFETSGPYSGEDDDLSSSALSSEQEKENFEYDIFASNVDRDDAFDNYQKNEKHILTPKFELRKIPPSYMDVQQTLSNIKGVKNSKLKKEYIVDDEFDGDLNHRTQSIDLDLLVPPSSKDVVSANGSNKEKRRMRLLGYYESLENLSYEKRYETYISRKAELLQKLKNLKDSKLSFTNSDIKDDELIQRNNDLEFVRDEELLRMKLSHNYESLQNSQVFYQNSNKIYKNLNSLMVNKLQKLKSFFELQKNLFNDIVKNSESEIFDIRNKESQRLVQGSSESDFKSKIKDAIKRTLENPQGSADSDAFNSHHHLHHPNTLVHDFMSLISPAEFEIITGDAPTNLKGHSSKDSFNSKTASAGIKHQIFQSSLYDPLTSGSDTNTSDGGSSTPSKRRGRRGAAINIANGTGRRVSEEGERSKQSEAVLLAKIMKQFSGPQAAKPNELLNDLELLGINTRWPVQSSR